VFPVGVEGAGDWGKANSVALRLKVTQPAALDTADFLFSEKVLIPSYYASPFSPHPLVATLFHNLGSHLTSPPSPSLFAQLFSNLDFLEPPLPLLGLGIKNSHTPHAAPIGLRLGLFLFRALIS
jgi:hypothetical protein